MTEQELIERLANEEHAGWSRYMTYLFEKCGRNPDGSITIPPGYVTALQIQIDTSYAELSEAEKQNDRIEVGYILPIIQEYAGGMATDAINHTVDRLVKRPLDLIDQAKLASSLAVLDEKVCRLQTEVFSSGIVSHSGKSGDFANERQTLRGRVNELSAMAALGEVEEPLKDE